MNNKKQLILSIGLVLVLVLMIVGISYAAFQFTGPGSKLNTITTGAITMEYTESDNIINMTGALPTTDATGKVRLTEGEYLDFTVKSAITGTTNINWEIAAEDVTSASKKIDGKYIKLYLTKLDDSNNESQVMAPKVFTVKTSENTKTGRPSGMMSLATDTMSSSETNKYRLRMYVDESYNPQGDGGDLSFSVKVNVYGKVKEEPKGSKLKAYTTDVSWPSTDFHTRDYKSKTTSIVTKADNEVPTTAIESWDLSEAGDGSLMAYAEDDGTGNGTYKVTIGGKEGIIANESMVNYFSNFDAITSINLSALDTSKTTDMSGMFSGCSSLTSLDVSNFDTSNVIDMNTMFYNISSVKTLDLTNFNTSKVTDMSSMFGGYESTGLNSFESIDLSSFDTSNVTDMHWMFAYCWKLKTLDLSNFNTSKVTDMSDMFDTCISLTNLNLTSFDTSEVTDMSYMFKICKNINNLDLSNFDTSKVTNMSSMFCYCSHLTNIDVSSFNTSNVTSMSAMFNGCSSLTTLDVSRFDTSKVTNMRYMFCAVNNIKELDLTSFDTSKVTDMSVMFNGCSNLTKITVSNKWVIGSSTDVSRMFTDCGTDHVTTI